MALRPLYGPLLPLNLYPHYKLLSPFRPSIPATAPVPSMALCPLYGSLTPLRRPYVPSMALCLLLGPLSPPWLSVLSMALGHLYGSLYPLWPSVPLTPYVSYVLCVPSVPSVPLKNAGMLDCPVSSQSGNGKKINNAGNRPVPD